MNCSDGVPPERRRRLAGVLMRAAVVPLICFVMVGCASTGPKRRPRR